jgi:uncharacterized protein with GYD domain
MKNMWFGNRKRMAIFLALMLAVPALLSGCGRSGESRYAYAQDLLAVEQYEAALYEFQALGEYEDASKFTMYTAAIIALNNGEMELAQVDFDNLGDFKSSVLYSQYVGARSLEQEEDYASAQAAYQALGSFKDSQKRLDNCTAMIPKMAYEDAKSLFLKGEYQKALEGFLTLGSYGDSASRAEACQQAILSQEYQAGQGLLRRKDYKGALEVFAALGSFRDSALQAETCRKELLTAAQAAEKAGGLDKVQEAIALYEALDTYSDSNKRAQELRAQYAVNLKLRGYQESSQYVTMGTYPQETSGGKTPILWRVLSVENGTALLLSEKVLDTAAMQPEGTFTGYAGSALQSFLNGAFLTEAFSAEEQAALAAGGTSGKVFLLSREEAMNPALGFVDDAARQSQGTPYALAKSLHAATTGEGWWWLNTKGQNDSSQAIVYYNGTVFAPGVRADDAQMGVRPAIRLQLSSLFFTQGTGTAADPFRK